MRSRSTLGILGSFAGFAGATTLFTYTIAALFAMTSPALGSSPNCTGQEINLIVAQASEETYLEIYTMAVGDYGMCIVNTGGPCTGEEINMIVSGSTYESYVAIRQQAEWDLMMCQSQF